MARVGCCVRQLRFGVFALKQNTRLRSTRCLCVRWLAQPAISVHETAFSLVQPQSETHLGSDVNLGDVLCTRVVVVVFVAVSDGHTGVVFSKRFDPEKKKRS